jgi:hypothetical protein
MDLAQRLARDQKKAEIAKALAQHRLADSAPFTL